jgi:hypothetical protein
MEGKGTRMLEELSGETLLYPIIGDPIIFVWRRAV